MGNKKLAILGIITACMIAWAIVQSHISSNPASESETQAYLIQGLDPTNIDSITLGKGEDKVTLKRKEGQFVVVNKDNYPAIPGEINNLITSCLDIQTSELYTDNPKNHKDLEVTEEEAKLLVKFNKPNSDLLAGVIAGKDKEQGRGSFVRMIPGNKVFVTLERPRIEVQAMNYVDKELISVDRKDIETVTVSSPDETYTLISDNDGRDIVLDNLPIGKKFKDNEDENVFTALADLTFDDVKAAPTTGKDLAFEKKFVCKLKNSTIYTLNSAHKDSKTYITCQAEFTDNTPVTKEEGVESEEELKKKEAKLLARDKAKEFSASHKGWVYEISEHKAKNLTKETSELLEDVKKEEEVKKDDE